jgi:diguanylate cyclase (GGDEF)-like protein
MAEQAGRAGPLGLTETKDSVSFGTPHTETNYMSKPTILVVDDEVFFRRLFTDILTEEDLYQVETANSGDEALERLASGGIDVVLTDMVMPGTCGLELVRRTRALDNPPEIILATGNATVESAIQALKSGAKDYLLKPCNPEQLRHIIHSCLEQRRLLDENSLLRSQIRLYQKGQNLAAQIDIKTLLDEAVHSLLHETGNGRGISFVANQETFNQIAFSDGVSEEQATALAEVVRPRIEEMKEATVFSAADLEITGDLLEDLRTLWIYPMHSDEGFKGAVVLCNQTGEELNESQPGDNLSFLAEQIVLGFQNACQFQGARELIYTDDLTGLYNHRYLQIALEQELRRAERYGLEFSLAFIDLDLFKQINDTHGHLVGSNVLKEVGDVLRTCVRDADMLFRYGGDEFTALLVETVSRGAKIVAERIRQALEEKGYTAPQGETCKLTATVGHATFPIHATTKTELIDLADKAMYDGKKDRNVTRSASEVQHK